MIYFIEAVGAGLVKIGFTDGDPAKRLRQLQTGCPHQLRLAAATEGSISIEAVEHGRWAYLREQGEWFRIDDRLRWYMLWLDIAHKGVAAVNGIHADEISSLHAQAELLRVQAAELRQAFEYERDVTLHGVLVELDLLSDRISPLGEVGRDSDLSFASDCRM